MIGRPKEFDCYEALNQAMEVFWANGYEATSVEDLLEGMGINRGSMYDTFGDKHTLFVKAVDHYGRTVMAKIAEILAAPGSPLENVRKLIRFWGQVAGDKECRGCLLCNTAVELAPHDEDIAETIRSMLSGLEKNIRKALDQAVAAGELKRATDTRALARFVTSTGQGLAVMGKASMGRGTIADVVAVTLTTLA